MRQRPKGVILVRRKSDGKIRCGMPDGTTQYVTDEEWKKIFAERCEKARREQVEQEKVALRARLSQLEKSG